MKIEHVGMATKIGHFNTSKENVCHTNVNDSIMELRLTLSAKAALPKATMLLRGRRFTPSS